MGQFVDGRCPGNLDRGWQEDKLREAWWTGLGVESLQGPLIGFSGDQWGGWCWGRSYVRCGDITGAGDDTRSEGLAAFFPINDQKVTWLLAGPAVSLRASASLSGRCPH